MSERYFCELPANEETAVLDGAEAHHLTNVMRASVGDWVVLFDGAGTECVASITQFGKRKVELRITQRQRVDREARHRLTLAVSLPKGDRQKWLVEKAVELGVATLLPLLTSRSVVKIKESGIERLRRAVIEASKQCGRNQLMNITSPRSLQELIEETPADATRLVSHPSYEDNSTSNFEIGDSSVIAAIGPEGGFTDEELQSAIDANWEIVSLGKRILRTETAALKLAAVFLRD